MMRSNVYFAWDPLARELELYDNKNDALNAAEATIQVARGIAFNRGDWPEWVTDVCVGKIELIATSANGEEDLGGKDYSLHG